jgi:hypothetical protein
MPIRGCSLLRVDVTKNSFLRGLVFVLLCIGAFGRMFPVHAGFRGPGKYSGVVVFDRWDTCFLLSGPYLTYIATDVKEQLRPYAGQAMQIEAYDLIQPMNPGDARVMRYGVLGTAPENLRTPVTDGLELKSESDFGTSGSAAILISVRNTGNVPIHLEADAFGPTLLAASPHLIMNPSDGKSAAWITRATLEHGTSWSMTVGDESYFANCEIDPASQFPKQFDLQPDQSVKSRITFKGPPGKYQFLVGYGGGVHEEKSIASNAISFDIDEKGTAKLAQ